MSLVICGLEKTALPMKANVHVEAAPHRSGKAAWLMSRIQNVEPPLMTMALR
jgi:hypothetical protein